MIIIGITGTLGAGKGAVAKFLVKNKGFMHYSGRLFLIDKLEKNGLESNRDNMMAIANKLRTKYGNSYIVDQLYTKVKVKNQNAIIESIRNVGELESLQGKDNFYLLAVDSQKEIRYERIKKRKSSTDFISFKKFQEQESKEMKNEDPNKQNISACIKLADFHIDNSKTLADLHVQIEKICTDLDI